MLTRSQTKKITNELFAMLSYQKDLMDKKPTDRVGSINYRPNTVYWWSWYCFIKETGIQWKDIHPFLRSSYPWLRIC